MLPLALAIFGVAFPSVRLVLFIPPGSDGQSRVPMDPDTRDGTPGMCRGSESFQAASTQTRTEAAGGLWLPSILPSADRLFVQDSMRIILKEHTYHASTAAVGYSVRLNTIYHSSIRKEKLEYLVDAQL